jgi:Amt family ammonium transporter
MSQSAQPIDFDDLVERCLGNLGFVERILTRFQTQFQSDLERLQGAYRASDANEIARVAHRMKGSAASVSARALQDVAGTVEDLGRTAQLDDIARHLDILASEWSRCVDHTTTLATPVHP